MKGGPNGLNEDIYIHYKLIGDPTVIPAKAERFSSLINKMRRTGYFLKMRLDVGSVIVLQK